MIKTTYNVNGKKIVEPKELAVFQSNHNGGFGVFPSKPRSRYDGLFFTDWNNRDVFKTIERFELPGEITDIQVDTESVTRFYSTGVSETLTMPDTYDALIYSLNKKSEVNLLMDCRAIFDNRQWGREYSLSVEHKCLVITYTKRNDSRESDGQSYKLHVAIFGEGMEYLPVKKWVEQHYDLDQKRGCYPFSRWLYNPCTMRVKEVVVAFSPDKAKAVETAINVYANRKKLIAEKKKRLADLIKGKSTNEALAIMAFEALHSKSGSFAGIPWFTQFWTRDEIISSIASIQLGQFDRVKTILGQYLNSINSGVLPRFKGALFNGAVVPSVPAIDGMGWLFVRVEQFIAELEKRKKLKTFLNSSEMDVVEDKLDTALNGLFNERVKDGLVHNNPDETWMDTSFKEDVRSGARIEIQALTLAMLKFHGKLLRKPDEREAKMKAVVRKQFWNGKILKDGVGDATARPNVFIAAYVYPELLTKKEWETCFDNTLPKLWLDWGGLSTISKDHPLFTPEDTGENVTSYHRGDSWFWVNNIAAIVLHRTNAKKYSKYVKAIVAASEKEQLEMGVAGASAEISSAKELRSEGCWIQAWSMATLIELLREI